MEEGDTMNTPGDHDSFGVVPWALAVACLLGLLLALYNLLATANPSWTR